LGSRFRDVLAGADPAAASRRPEPAVWSRLEDACPVRDVVLVQRDPRGARAEDNPSFARMHRDERILLRRYDADALSDVLGQLATAAKLCATVFDGLHGTACTRRLVCNWPAPPDGDLAWPSRHTVNGGDHHLMHVRKMPAATSGIS
jgi:hypothetical protein